MICLLRQGKFFKNKEMGLHQTKKILHSKGNQHQNKKTTTELENIFTHTSDKELISKIYKVLKKLNTKKSQTTQLKKWAKDLNRPSPKRNTDGP